MIVSAVPTQRKPPFRGRDHVSAGRHRHRGRHGRHVPALSPPTARAYRSVFEAGSGVGGTWYWNRYPGARFDSESYSYGYSFSPEVLQEWDWREHFSAQPETLRYLEFVADKFDLRRDIQFNSRVAAASYDESGNAWEIVLQDGGRARAQFLITAIGPLSTPTMPNIQGMESVSRRGLPHGPVASSSRDLRRQASGRDRHWSNRRSGDQELRRPPAISPSSSARRTIARRRSIGRSTRRPSSRSRPAIPRSSNGAGSRMGVSCTRRICARRWR